MRVCSRVDLATRMMKGQRQTAFRLREPGPVVWCGIRGAGDEDFSQVLYQASRNRRSRTTS